MLTSLSELIARFDDEIASAKARGSRLGFFQALYRRVTIEVKRRIDANLFAHPDLVTRLDLDFANRYFQALDASRARSSLSRCWQLAFDAASNDRLLIVQHLLLGMNAHINFDLAISTAHVAGSPAGLTAMQSDFESLSAVLGDMVDDVEQHIGEVSPRFGELDELAGGTDEALVGFSIDNARNHAWRTAELLVRLGSAAGLLQPVQDGLVRGFGQALISPAVLVAVQPIRIAESNDLAHVIDVLNRA